MAGTEGPVWERFFCLQKSWKVSGQRINLKLSLKHVESFPGDYDGKDD